MRKKSGEILEKFSKYRHRVSMTLLIFGSACMLIYCWQLWHFYNTNSNKVVESDNSGSAKTVVDNQIKDSQEGEEEFFSMVVVDIAGAVKKPGIYRLKQNARLNDLILLAGGFLPTEADKKYIAQELNLAIKLADGEKYYIPYWQDNIENAEASQIVTTSKTQQPTLSADKHQVVEKISLNNASSSELETLSGIGKVRSQAIISHRPYRSLIDLVNKKIISEKLFNQLKEEIKL